jgi:hypothetical protein
VSPPGHSAHPSWCGLAWPGRHWQCLACLGPAGGPGRTIIRVIIRPTAPSTKAMSRLLRVASSVIIRLCSFRRRLRPASSTAAAQVGTQLEDSIVHRAGALGTRFSILPVPEVPWCLLFISLNERSARHKARTGPKHLCLQDASSREKMHPSPPFTAGSSTASQLRD